MMKTPKRPSMPATADTSRLEDLEASLRRVTLPSGLTLIHAPLPHDERFYLGLMVKAGSRYEAAKHAGISHFLEHMMFRGSKSHPTYAELAEAFEWLGGEWNAATGHEHTEYWYSGCRASHVKATKIFADFIKYPLLTDIEIERQIIRRELQGEMNEFGHSTDLDLHSASLHWPSSALAKPIIGFDETLGNISTADLIRYRERWYRPENMIVCVTGGPGSDEMIELMETHFSFPGSSGVSSDKVTPASINRAGPKALWVENSDNEYQIQLSFVCGGEWSPEAPSVEALARVLADGFSARLTRRLREELGLVYDISSEVRFFSDTGSLDINASVGPERIDEFFDELFTLVRDLATKGPAPRELERVQRRTLIDLDLLPMHPEELGFRIAWDTLGGRADSLVRERQLVEQLTAERVRETAATILTAKGAALVVLGPVRDGLEGELKAKMLKELP